jgi:hypothetical protein
MPGVPNSHLPGRGITDLTSRGRYEDDLASYRKGLRTKRGIEERLESIESQLSLLGFLWVNIDIGNDYTVPGPFYHVRCNTVGGNITVTLPPVDGLNGVMVSVMKFTGDVNTVTIVPDGLDFLGVPAGMDVLSSQWDNLSLICINQDGTNGWDII